MLASLSGSRLIGEADERYRVRTRLHAWRLLRKGHPLGTGTSALPKLFGASLGVALIAAPAASAFLGRQSISRWLQKLGK